jgi:hypothetical protein
VVLQAQASSKGEQKHTRGRERKGKGKHTEIGLDTDDDGPLLNEQGRHTGKIDDRSKWACILTLRRMYGNVKEK